MATMSTVCTPMVSPRVENQDVAGETKENRPHHTFICGTVNLNEEERVFEPP